MQVRLFQKFILALSFGIGAVAYAQTDVPADEVKPAEEIEEEVTEKAEEKPSVSGFLQKVFGTEEEAKEAGGSTEPPETDESQAAIPEALNPEGDTGEPPDRYLPEEYKSASRKWEAPNYSSQDNALGWSAQSFAVPEGLRKRVDFWISIYSK